MNFAQDFHAKRRKDEQWLRHKSQYNNANYEDFSRNYDALQNNQTDRISALTNGGLLDNSFVHGMVDKAYRVGRPIASALGYDTARGDANLAKLRIHHDSTRDHWTNSLAYGLGTMVTDPINALPFSWGARPVLAGQGLLKGTLEGAKSGFIGGSVAGLLDSVSDPFKSTGQVGWETLGSAAGGGVLGGLLGTAGASLLGRTSGYGLLNRAKGTTPSGGGLLDSEIAKGIREEMGIQRPTRWQTTAPQQQANMVGQSHWYPNTAATAQDNVRLKIADNVQMSMKPNFVMVGEPKTINPIDAELELVEAIARQAKLDNTIIRASLETLRQRHPEMFKSRGDVFRLLREIKNNPNYVGDSLRDPNVIYLAVLATP